MDYQQPQKRGEIPVSKPKTQNTNTPKKNPSLKNIPKKIPPQKAREIQYHTAEKTSISEFIKKAISKEFIPTKKSGYALGVIFLLVIIIGLLQFPFGSFLKGQGEFAIKIGIPYSFLVFDIIEPEKNPLIIKGLLLDLLIYIVIAYIIDVLINLAIRFIKSSKKSEKEKKPEVIKTPKSTLADKLTKQLTQPKQTPLEKKYKPRSKSIEVFEIPKTKQQNNQRNAY